MPTHRQYYAAIGNIPRFNEGPKWSEQSHADGRADLKEHQNQVSRHRETVSAREALGADEQWVRPPTPPGYWEIGFPNTQDVELQNDEADRMVAEKEVRIRQEAE